MTNDERKRRKFQEQQDESILWKVSRGKNTGEPSSDVLETMARSIIKTRITLAWTRVVVVILAVGTFIDALIRLF